MDIAYFVLTVRRKCSLMELKTRVPLTQMVWLLRMTGCFSHVSRVGYFAVKVGTPGVRVAYRDCIALFSDSITRYTDSARCGAVS